MKRAKPVLACAAAVAVLSGCASLPTNSAPHVIRTFAPQESEQPAVGPQEGREPDLLIRDFYAAAAIPDTDYEAARSYLTEAAAGAWDPSGQTLVVDSLGITTTPGAAVGERTFAVHGAVVGSLQPGGSFAPERGTYEANIDLELVDGEWRIASLPAGVVIERTELRNQYQPYNLYFFDAEGKELVTDRRWVHSPRDTLGSSLITLLMEGPAERLRPALTGALPSSAAFTGFQDGAYTFTGFGGVDEHERTRFAAQVVWTLASAGITGPYNLQADGQQLIDGADSLDTDDFVDVSPLVEVVGETTLYALSDGKVKRVEDGLLTDVSGVLGDGDVASADITGGGEWAAVLSKDAKRGQGNPGGQGGQHSQDGGAGDSLWVGKFDGRETEVLTAGTLTRPTFEQGADAVWTVADGQRIMRTVQSAATGEIATGQVTAELPEGVDGNISVLRLSRTGTRAVMVIDGSLYTGIVKRSASGERSIVNVLEYAQELGGTVVAADWRADGSLIVGTSASNVPVMRVEQDGSSMTALSTGNITSPVVAVAASPSTVYVTDANAVLQVPASGEDNPIWREVPGLEGVRALPVVAR